MRKDFSPPILVLYSIRAEREPLLCQPQIMLQIKYNLDLTFSSSPIHCHQDKNSAGKKRHQITLMK